MSCLLLRHAEHPRSNNVARQKVAKLSQPMIHTPSKCASFNTYIVVNIAYITWRSIHVCLALRGYTLRSNFMLNTDSIKLTLSLSFEVEYIESVESFLLTHFSLTLLDVVAVYPKFEGPLTVKVFEVFHKEISVHAIIQNMLQCSVEETEVQSYRVRDVYWGLHCLPSTAYIHLTSWWILSAYS